MNEIDILKLFLLLGFILAPVMTKAFFLQGSKLYASAHGAALVVLLVGNFLNVPYSVFAWPLFCALGFFLHLQKQKKNFLEAPCIAAAIPFLFSLISSVWFVSGSLDLHLLGYGEAWSFYAALHGAYLGWLLVGCIAHLAQRPSTGKPFLMGAFLSLPLFLFVAFGINGVPVIKRVGVIGFSLLMPILIGSYFLELAKSQRVPRVLCGISLFAISLTLTLALSNEFWAGFPRSLFGLPTMVLTHGLLNALVAVPFFFAAIWMDRRRGI